MGNHIEAGARRLGVLLSLQLLFLGLAACGGGGSCDNNPTLELTVDPAQSTVQLISCSLQVRS